MCSCVATCGKITDSNKVSEPQHWTQPNTCILSAHPETTNAANQTTCTKLSTDANVRNQTHYRTWLKCTKLLLEIIKSANFFVNKKN